MEQNPGMKPQDVSRTAGEWWRNLSEADKDIWRAESIKRAQAKSVNPEMNPGYTSSLSD